MKQIKRTKEQKNTTKTINKMAISTYLPIITLNIKWSKYSNQEIQGS